MNISISKAVAKLGPSIPSISLTPALSCRKDAPCASGCYAKKGNFKYEKVKNCYLKNYNFYMDHPQEYFKEIISFLNDGLVSYKYFRWHTAGDIVDNAYLLGMIETAKKCKNVKFLCFTKKFNLINEFLSQGNKIPNNLHIVFSAWHNAFKVNNPYNLPVAYVFFKRKELNPDIPELALPCSGDCSNCLACWSLKKGQSVYFNQH